MAGSRRSTLSGVVGGNPSWCSAYLEDDLPLLPPSQSGRTLQPNLTRRSHKKSRAGCFSCKLRKIKCGEQQPQCHHCVGRSEDCVYPTPKENVTSAKRHNTIPPILLATGGNFSSQDMLFFHHFITVAYPHLPPGNEAVWVNQVPQLAQHHPYLMHAILALGASHLDHSTLGQESYSIIALTYRTRAMENLNRILAQPDLDCDEADAVLATCYILTLQTKYLVDGMIDFFTLIRGCSLVITRIKAMKSSTIFDLSPERQQHVSPQSYMMPQPVINPVHILMGLESLTSIQPYLCSALVCNFSQALCSVLVASQNSMLEARQCLTKLYTMWSSLPQRDLNRFLDPSNATAQILFAHFLAMELVMVPMTKLEWPDRLGVTPYRALLTTMSWAKDVMNRVPSTLQQYLEWPKSIVATANAEITGCPFTGPAVIMLEDPEMLFENLGSQDHSIHVEVHSESLLSMRSLGWETMDKGFNATVADL